MIGLALFEPEIPQNTGTLMRLSACFKTELHIIQPCGFLLDDRRLSRSVMGYKEHAVTSVHDSYERFKMAVKTRRIITVAPRRGVSFLDFTYSQNDILLLGKESVGLPEEIIDSFPDCINIPIADEMDSLNLAVSASIVISEALRQLNLFKPSI